MPRGTGNQHGHPNGGHPAITVNPMTNHPYQAATHYNYATYAQLAEQNPSASVSATQLSESIVQRLTPGLNAAFSTLHQNTLTHVEKIQTSVQALSTSLSDARGEAHKETVQVANIVEASHTLQTKAIKRVLNRVDKLEKNVGENDGTSLMDRILSIEFAVAELIERARDPDAPVTPIIRRDAATSPRRATVPPAKQYKNASVSCTPPQLPSQSRVQSPRIDYEEPREGTERSLEQASDALRSRIRASVEALKSAIGGDLFEDISEPGPSRSPIRDQSDVDAVNHQDVQAGAATIVSRFPTAPFAADRLAKPAEWSTKGVHPSSLASTSGSEQAAMSDLPSKSSGRSQQQSFSPSPVPIRPARDIPEGSIASLRQSALGDHLFVHPLEDTGLPKLNPETTPPLDVSYPPPDLNTSAPTSALPSPPATTSPEDTSFELPDIATINENGPEPVSTAPGTSPGPPGEENNPELAMKQELDTISRIIPSSPGRRREETLSPLSSLEEDEQERSVSTHNALVNDSIITSSFTRPEESLSSLSALGNDSDPEDEPLEQSPCLTTDNSAVVSVPLNGQRRSKRKLNVISSQRRPMPMKKLKTETATTSIPSAKNRRGRPRKGGPQQVGTTTQTIKPKSRSWFKSKSLSIASTSYDWPTKTEDEARYRYIQCDNCVKWYHYGCVGIVSGDLRIEEDEQFICPPCHHEPATRVTLRGHEDECARPDCSFPGHAEEEGEFVVEKIVGRKPTADANTDFLWLIKWDGYPITMAEWCPEENMGDCAKLVLKFNEDVAAEGLDIDTDKLILLQQAIEGGWTG